MSERLAYAIQKYSLLFVLVLVEVLLILAGIGAVALMSKVPEWRVVAWAGLAGILAGIGAVSWGIYDEVRYIRKTKN